jgi:hypothetical protein
MLIFQKRHEIASSRAATLISRYLVWLDSFQCEQAHKAACASSPSSSMSLPTPTCRGGSEDRVFIAKPLPSLRSRTPSFGAAFFFNKKPKISGFDSTRVDVA